jgi:hypothetical protein
MRFFSLLARCLHLRFSLASFPAQSFEEAAKAATALTRKPDQATMLKLYGLYKQVPTRTPYPLLSHLLVSSRE